MISDVAYSCSTAEDGRFSIDWMMGAAERISGYSIEEIKAQRCWRFLVVEQDLALFEKHVTGLAPGSQGSCELRIRHKNGGITWVDSYAECARGAETPERFFLYGGLIDITERKHAEEELRTNKLELSNAMEMAKLGHWEYDVASDLFTFNDQFYKIFHTTAEQVGGYRMSSAEYAHRFVHPDDRDVVSGEEIQKSIESTDADSIPQMEHRILYADGTVGYITVRIFIVRDSQGRIVKTYGVDQDITERKQSEEEYKTILHTSMDGFTIDDMQGRILEVNDAYCRLTGYSRDELLTMRILDVEAEERGEETAQRLKRIMKVGGDRFETRHRRKDGSTVDVEVSVKYIDAGGGRFFVFARDITERKRAEEALRESEENFRCSLDDSPLGVRIVTLEGKTLYANRAVLDIYGYDSAEELRTTSIKNRYTPQSYAEFKTRLENRKGHDDESPEYEISIVRKNGEIRHLQVFRKNVLWNGERQFLVIYQDITERKQAEEQLRKSLEQLRRAMETTIQVLVMAVEMKDPYTAGHQRRMTNLARTMATEMGLPLEKIEGLRLAGVIHDIGKITLPTEILSKPMKLSAVEFSLIREHVRLGYEILKDVESPWPLAEIIYQHHERMDGSGYPRNLKGEEILIEARILAVADVVEAMSSHRPYRPALGIDAALEEIEKNRGLLYDSPAVDACLKVFREKGYQIEST
jgi:PAS domain S-box-containing protein/putative nucleotidyltransferase with HDIG domain